MFTKSIERLPISKNRFDEFKKRRLKEIIAKKAESVEKEFEDLCAEFDAKFESHEWIWLSKKDDKAKEVYYIPEITAIMPNLDKWVCAEYSTGGYYDTDQIENLDFFGFVGDLPTEVESRTCFNVKGRERYCFDSSGYLKICGNSLHGIIFKKQNEYWYLFTYNDVYYVNKSYKIPTKLKSDYKMANVPIHRFDGINAKQANAACAFIYWLENDLEPDVADGFKCRESKEAFAKLQEIYDKYSNFLSCTDKITLNKEAILETCLERNVPNFLEDAKTLINSDTVTDEDFAENFFEELRNCDYNRIMLEPYDSQLLTQQNRGHWDLWDYDVKEVAGEILLSKPLVARNPVVDVNDAGIVAIDFGTKSTIVAYEDENSKINLLQVGSGDYSRGTKAKNFENPTIIEFMRLKKFLEAYNERCGRPRTSFNDVAISHTAFNDLKKSSNSELYTSFFDNIKQWCGQTGNGVRITDATGAVTELPSFANIGEDDLNPLEIYAYYIGSYINHMLQEKHIFLKYILSFPVTYEVNLREKMRQSFEKGLLKSLPTALLSNEEKMKNFSVTQGASEPAAYAITALEHYGFNDMEEPLYYGVFDFGGGTTDFDFGLYRPLEKGRYAYELLHFGAYGDRTLGGENLLDLLAFNVFKANEDRLLNINDGSDNNCKITFSWPADKVNFPNSEKLITNSQESRLNMYNLREKLRPFLENPQSEEVKDMMDSASIRVNLFANDGTMFANYDLSLLKEPVNLKTEYKKSVQFDEFDDFDELNFDVEPTKVDSDNEKNILDLKGILKERISAGIDNFFIALKDAFEKSSGGKENGIDSLSNVQEIAIFLAGNASRAALVKELFEEYTQEGGRARELLDLGQCEKTPHFMLYPPLGTKDAWKIQEDLGVTPQKDIDAPTGKTGVAYGLLLSRAGGEIKVTDITPHGEKTPFRFFVGRRERKIFKVVIDNNTEFNKWYNFIDADEETFDLFYTDQAIASTNNAPVTIAKRLTLTIDNVNADANVYVRAVNSNTIEYAVAKSEDELSNLYDEDFKRIEFV